MYANSIDDPIIKYYDQTFALTSPIEIAWYITKATNIGSPIVDLACGTGRISIELAKRNFLVFSIDNSSGMLDIFRHKLQSEAESVKSNIQITNQSMNNFNINNKCKLIICCDAFFHNLTISDQKNCLLSIYNCLLDDGYFLFNIHNNPNPHFLNWLSSKEASQYNERGKYILNESNELLRIEQALFHDPLEQIIETKLHFIKIDCITNKITEDSFSSWKSRYLCKFEMIHLLELCGFTIESIVGDYNNGPVTIESQLIFICRKKKETA
jgi:SAM-dependent methyltransferase